MQFRIKDLSFVNRDYDFKRRHLSDLAKPEWEFVERVKRGVYIVPEDIPEMYRRYKEESGELKTEKNELAKTISRRASWKFLSEIKKAMREGRDPDEVPVPKEMKKSEGVQILEREQKKEEDRRIFEEFAEASRQRQRARRKSDGSGSFEDEYYGECYESTENFEHVLDDECQKSEIEERRGEDKEYEKIRRELESFGHSLKQMTLTR